MFRAKNVAVLIPAYNERAFIQKTLMGLPPFLDRIVVIDDGRAVEDGTHDDLLAQGGRYAAMWRAFDLEAPAHAPALSSK